jgi:hypothetical protein
MIRYEEAQNNPRRLLGLTSLLPPEFEYLLSHFSPLCEHYFRYHTYTGKKREIPKFKPQSDEKLPQSSDKLLFLLIYMKNNCLQEFQAAFYDMSQGQVSNLVRVLTPLLDQALHKMGLAPARDSQSLKRQLQTHPEKVFNQDATQRPIGRKVDHEAQKEDFSGKSKSHTDKNHILCDEASQILYLSPTYPGSVHDKALIDQENLEWLPHIILRQDTGYQGYAPLDVTILQPTKKPRGAELTESQKQENKAIASAIRFKTTRHRRKCHCWFEKATHSKRPNPG